MNLITKTIALLLIMTGVIIIFSVLSARADAPIESMTCDKFTVFTKDIQKQFLVKEITRTERHGVALSMCIRRHSNDLRRAVIFHCDQQSNFDNALGLASRKIRTACLINGDFDFDVDSWEDLEVPFYNIQRP